MKKILMLILLLTAYGNIFAFLTQASWRWRNDNGSQTTATWKADQNTTVTLTSASEVIRLRVEVYNNTGGAVAVLDTLQYATSTTGPWTNLDTLAGSAAFMLATTSAFVVQDEPTTAQLTGVALPFVAGKVMVDSMVLKNYSLADQFRTEFEWAITGTANTAPNTTYYFRHWGATATDPLPLGTTYPSLTTAGVLPIKLIAFNVNREGKKVKLEWSTASEQNNDRYEIRRSSDGTTWKTITSIKGNGNTTGTSSYKVYDESPLIGNNYYTIKQYDIDGRFSQSVVKLVKMSKLNSLISVYPNPTKSGVNFSIEDISVSNMEATLTNMSGSIIHQEIFKNITANAINKLNLAQQPAPGVYILKLKAANMSESVSVVIE